MTLPRFSDPGSAPHDHRERTAVQPHFERLLGRRTVAVGGAASVADPRDVDLTKGVGHRAHLTSRTEASGLAAVQ
jgi:hypothetical protein